MQLRNIMESSTYDATETCSRNRERQDGSLTRDGARLRSRAGGCLPNSRGGRLPAIVLALGVHGERDLQQNGNGLVVGFTRPLTEPESWR